MPNGVRECNRGHCHKSDREIWELCEALDLEAGYPVLTRDEDGPCTCACSCLAFGTPIQTAADEFKAVETFVVGDSVMATGKDLASFEPRAVQFSAGTSGVTLQDFAVLVVYENGSLVVTDDHLFLLPDRSLRRADRLTTNDQLLSPGGDPVPIISLHIGTLRAGFHHIATTLDDPDENASGHILVGGVGAPVLFGDYVLQIRARAGDAFAGFNPDEERQRPVLGSREYVEAYGPESRQGPDSTAGFASGTVTVEVGGFLTDDIGPNTFVPADSLTNRIPADACSFISPEEAQERAQDPHRAFSDPHSRQWSEALTRLYGAFYPDVTYHVDWADEDVNAYAWVENGVRHVSLKGGLIRHLDLELEGLALILAHELGHHYGGPPTFPHGLSCEGQADYTGVRDVMRNVWFGMTYITTTDAAIQQMADFFNVPNDPNPPGGAAACSHPPGACRVATYHAAVTLAGKPGCA